MIRSEDVDYLASLSRIKVAVEEQPTLIADLEKILNYVSELTTLVVPEKTNNKVLNQPNIFRADVASSPDPVASQALVAAAPATERGFIKVKKIIGG